MDKIKETKIQVMELIEECESLEELASVLYTSQKVILGILEDNIEKEEVIFSELGKQ